MLFSQLVRSWSRLFAPQAQIQAKYDNFRELLRADAAALDLVADLEPHLYGDDPADPARVRSLSTALIRETERMVGALERMNSHYSELSAMHAQISEHIRNSLAPQRIEATPPYIISLDDAGSHPRLAGGKATNLSLARNAGVPTPDGFVITAPAFGLFLRHNELEAKIEQHFEALCLSNHDAIVRVTGELQELILEGEIPPTLEATILTSTNALSPNGELLAVRSSALAEDGQISFAGQYASELHVRPEDILTAYKRVLAGKYCPRAIAYRIRHGLTDAETTMAVLVLPMVEASSSGVVYTCDPACPAIGGTAMGVYVVNGLAANLVDGSATPGKYYLSREENPRVLQGCACDNNSLFPEDILQELGGWCMRLERAFGEPQDVEWTFGPDGLRIVQTRRLHQTQDPQPSMPEDTSDYEILVSGLNCASPGAACGPVHHAPSGSNFRSIPAGSMVVTATLRPALSQFLDRISAVIASSGSRASHFASVARERGVPVVVGDTGAKLVTGETITVDAVSGRIFAGCVAGVLAQNKAAMAAQAIVRREHADVASKTVHLNLTDPEDPGFSPAGCRSLHDIIRFCHEKSVYEMFSLVQRSGRGLGRSRRLITDLPLVMYILDLGGGLAPQASNSGTVQPASVSSNPMRALWQGLSNPGIEWDHSQHHVDWEEFDRISAGIFRHDSRLLASYALVGADYMHLNIRFGYHFSIVDSVCSENAGANYVNFRFKGGGAGLAQRLHRLEFISTILSRAGYDISTKGDILDASAQRLERPQTEQCLEMLGLVLAATRLMDVRLTSAEQARHEAESFLQRFRSEICS